MATTYTLTGLTPGNTYGFAVIGNTVYFPLPNGVSSGLIGAGPTINLTLHDPTRLPTGDDFGSCPLMVVGTVTAAATGGTLACVGNNTLNISLNTAMGPATFSWTGPSIVGSTTRSVATVGAVGEYTCIATPIACANQTIFTAAVSNPVLTLS